MPYFSEREDGELPRTETEITTVVWDGIVAQVRTGIEDGSFGATFPENCLDGAVPSGTDETLFLNAMKADNPGLAARDWLWASDDLPTVSVVMDMIEFCWRVVGKPEQLGYHDYHKHYHLNFDAEAGRNEFRDAVNQIFRRNGMAFELTQGGEIQRLVPVVLREALVQSVFTTGDGELDNMLETARTKFLDPDEVIRRQALQELWDAWERVKTVEPGKDKRESVTALLDRSAAAGGEGFRKMLEVEALELTRIGNSFQIRHSETTQERLNSAEHLDYLFHRLFSLVRMILRTTDRGG